MSDSASVAERRIFSNVHEHISENRVFLGRPFHIKQFYPKSGVMSRAIAVKSCQIFVARTVKSALSGGQSAFANLLDSFAISNNRAKFS